MYKNKQFESLKMEAFVAINKEKDCLFVDLQFSSNVASTSKLGHFPCNLFDVIVEVSF